MITGFQVDCMQLSLYDAHHGRIDLHLPISLLHVQETVCYVGLDKSASCEETLPRQVRGAPFLGLNPLQACARVCTKSAEPLLFVALTSRKSPRLVAR